MGWVVNPTRDSLPIVQEAWWSLGPIGTGVENLASTDILSPDRTSGNESLY